MRHKDVFTAAFVDELEKLAIAPLLIGAAKAVAPMLLMEGGVAAAGKVKGAMTRRPKGGPSTMPNFGG